MEQLQQASGGQGESIQASVASANYAPFESQMGLGSKLMEQGFSGASATQRQMMAEDAVRQRDMAQYRREDQLAQKKDRAQMMEYKGTLTQMLAEMDDIIDNSDMNDPVIQERMPAILRKREQMAQLLATGGQHNNMNYLGGILKQGTATGMLTPWAQGSIRERASQTEEAPQQQTNQEEKKPSQQKKSEETHVSESPSSNTIDL